MTRLKQAGIIGVGLLVAAAMVVLGVWQLDVYKSQGANTAAARAAAPALNLREVAPAGSAVRDGFGRSVRFTGHYDPSLQLLVGSGGPGGYRVLTGLVQADGSVVPVVRGMVPTLEAAPPPPTGTVSEVGVLLPSEDDAPSGSSSELSIDAVRLPVLAQQWSGQLVGGFVTLSTADAVAQGLTPATLALPEAKGRLRNGAYAFQWWLFAAFALAMAIRMARDLELHDDPELEDDLDVEGGGATGSSETEQTPIGSVLHRKAT